MMPAAVSEPRPKEDQFEQRAAAVLRQLRGAISAVIGAIPGHDAIGRPTDLQRVLLIPSTLAWQIYKVAYASDPVGEANNVPGSAAMLRFIDAAADRGVPSKVVQAGRDAVREFETFVKSYAGTRSSFDSMVAALHNGVSESVDLQYRRAAFKANSHIWGVQAKTQLACYVFRANADDQSQLDFIGLRGLLGLKRLRRDASWVVSHARVADDDGHIRRPIDRVPIDPIELDSPGVSLLRDYCSQPLPQFRTMMTESGFMNVELASTDVGSKSAITCLIGDIYQKAFTRHKDENNQKQTAQSMVRTPCERLIHDVLAPRGIFGSATPTVMVYGDHRNVDPALPGRDCDLLAMSASAAYLGRGPSVLHTPAIPRYSEMVQYAMDKAGWDAESLDVYRCEVEYPVMPSSVVVQFELLETN
jgi:hypothetical protein